MALQLCHSHCRGLRSRCGVCPLVHWQPTCQPLASEMLPWTGCDIGGAERSLKSFKLHILPRCFDMIDCGKKGGNLYHMYNCDHRVSSTTSSKSGPSWPPSRSGLTGADPLLTQCWKCLHTCQQGQFQIILSSDFLLKFQCF